MKDPIGVGKGPQKILVETFHSRILNGLHTLTFVSGEEEFTFVMQLPHSKAIGRAITKQIQELEKQIGKEIKDVGLSDEPVLSPINLDADKK